MKAIHRETTSNDKLWSAADALLRGTKPTVNACEVTIERLGSAIKMGLYEPGDRLPTERELAAIIGVSRATVREAIRLLSEQGILVSKRGRMGGTFVAEKFPVSRLPKTRGNLIFNASTIAEILDRRLVIEMGTAQLAAQRAQIEQIEDLQALVVAMDEADSYSEYRKLDIRFHILIARATNNNLLQATIADIQADLTDFLLSVPYSSPVRLNSSEQHQEIITAIRDRNPEAARLSMQKHVLGTRSYLQGLLLP
jgi:GntR family transcriptional regulator, transcriptional repressor for pyruvate dehydrogenase complex